MHTCKCKLLLKSEHEFVLEKAFMLFSFSLCREGPTFALWAADGQGLSL